MSVERTHSLAWRIMSQFGLSARLLLLTVLFVMIAEVLIYVPSIANFRQTWLNDRIAAAQIAAMVLDAASEEALPEELEMRLLSGVGAKAIAIRSGGRRSLLARGRDEVRIGRGLFRGPGARGLLGSCGRSRNFGRCRGRRRCSVTAGFLGEARLEGAEVSSWFLGCVQDRIPL